MTVLFENYTHSFYLGGKPVFAPTRLGRLIGNDVKKKVEAAYTFERFFHHRIPGGHVAALHSHRQNRFFCKLDIENFFYSIGRNRVTKSLRASGIPRASHYAKWSSVKNPYSDPSYSLPYGFVQSPILATLVLARSSLGDTLRRISTRVQVSVYVDDISMSSNEFEVLANCFNQLREGCTTAGFQCSVEKTIAPTDMLQIFNCSLKERQTLVLPERIEEFNSRPHTNYSRTSFDRYCSSISDGNE